MYHVSILAESFIIYQYHVELFAKKQYRVKKSRFLDDSNSYNLHLIFKGRVTVLFDLSPPSEGVSLKTEVHISGLMLPNAVISIRHSVTIMSVLVRLLS